MVQENLTMAQPPMYTAPAAADVGSSESESDNENDVFPQGPQVDVQDAQDAQDAQAPNTQIIIAPYTFVGRSKEDEDNQTTLSTHRS